MVVDNGHFCVVLNVINRVIFTISASIDTIEVIFNLSGTTMRTNSNIVNVRTTS